MKRRFPVILRNLSGPLLTWYLARRSRRLAADYPARLRDALSKVSPSARASNAHPVFVLSAGWRSGSTLLQRMIMENNKDILMWGEPFDHSHICEGMASQFRSFTARWPPENCFLSARGKSKLADEWVATLYPDMDYLLEAHRKFFDGLFGEQARETGRSEWGLKEVRLTVDHAAYLRALYPDCKLLFLYRNPLDAYLSYRNWGVAWYRHWPDKPVPNAFSFGRNWAGLTRDFIDRHSEVNGILVRYEDLDNPKDVKRIEEYLGWPMPRSSELRRIGEGASSAEKGRVPRFERILLGLGAGKIYNYAGY